MDRNRTNNLDNTHQHILPNDTLKNFIVSKSFETFEGGFESMKIKQNGRPSKVKNSKFRKNIDDFLTEGKPYTYISKWLNDKGESISPSSIRRYHKNDFNIQKKGVEKYYDDKESEKKLNESATEYSDDIHKIDKYLEQADEKLNLAKLSPGQLAQFIVQLLREKRERLKQDGDIILNLENKIGEENIFEYSSDEMEMIKNWGKQQDKEFIDKL